jgi:O-antigen ligase
VCRDKHWILAFISRKRVWVISAFLLALINVVFSSSYYPSVYKWVKIVEAVSLGLYIYRDEDKHKVINLALFCSAVFFSMIGMAQLLKGSTIGGPLYLLGERSFTLGTPGIALVNVFGQEFLRAYSTFPHPNALAGFLGVVILLSFKINIRPVYKYTGLFVLTTCFILSFSLGAFISLGAVLALSIYRIQNKPFGIILLALIMLSLLLPLLSKNLKDSNITQGSSVSQRLDLSYASGQMISERFITGEGLNTFVINIPRFKTLTSYQWFLQPVHNIFLLVFSESGILGLVLFCFVIFVSLTQAVKQKSEAPVMVLLFILFTGFFDHYWLTLQQNLLLFSLVIGLSFRGAKL